MIKKLLYFIPFLFINNLYAVLPTVTIGTDSFKINPYNRYQSAIEYDYFTNPDSTNTWTAHQVFDGGITVSSLTVTSDLELGFSSGSVVFQGKTGLTEDNTNFFWDEDNNRLGIGINTPTSPLHVIGTATVATILFQDSGTQDYHIQNIPGDESLCFAGENSGDASLFRWFSKDGDTTDSVLHSIYGLGKCADTANRERLVSGWNTARSNFEIFAEYGGTGIARDLDIYTNGNQYQLFVATNGFVGINTELPDVQLEVNGAGLYTGNLEISKADPTITLADTVSNSSVTWNKLNANNEINSENNTSRLGGTGAVYFDGTALNYGKVLDGNYNDFPDAFTLMVRWKADLPDTIRTVVTSFEESGVDGLIIEQNSSGDGGYTGWVGSTAGLSELRGTTNVTGDWDTIFLSRSSTTNVCTLRVNDVNQADTETNAGAISTDGTAHTIFALRRNLVTPNLGAVDEAAMWNRELSEAEMVAIYGGGTDPIYIPDDDPGLTAKWSFFEGLGDTFYDSSSGKSTGTLIGSDYEWVDGLVESPATTGSDLWIFNKKGDVFGETSITGLGVGTGRLHLYYNTSERHYMGASEVMRIDSNGNVGIGTTSPGTTLEVNGDITVTNDILSADGNDLGLYEQTGTKGLEIDSAGDGTFTNNLTVSDTLTVTKGILASTATYTSDVDIAGTLTTTGAGGIVNTYGIETSSIYANSHINISTTAYDTFYQQKGDFSAAGEGYFGEGLITSARKYGSGLMARQSLDFQTRNLIYSNGDGVFTAESAQIYIPGADFIGDGVIVNDFIAVTGSVPSYQGAIGEILKVETSTITVSLATGGGGTLADATNMTIAIFNKPVFFAGDNGDIHMGIGKDVNARFHIELEEARGDCGIAFDFVSAKNSQDAMCYNVDVGTYSSVGVQHMNIDVTDFNEAGDISNIVDVVIDNSGATAGDVHVIDVEVTDPTNTDLEVEAIATRPGVDVIRQYLGTQSVLGAGFQEVAALYVDSTTAFNSAVNNVPVFANDNDEIVICSTIKFDEINVILDTPAIQNVLFLSYFSSGTPQGSWDLFLPGDGTNGFQQSGTLKFSSDDLVGWSTMTVTNITEGDITDGTTYYAIKLIRTRNTLAVTPVEKTIQVTTLGTDFRWNKTGDIESNSVAVTDGITEPDTRAGFAIIYIDSITGDLSVKFGDGTVKTIVTDTP